MLFFIVILIAIGVIGFFHYIQGFFSATISAILAAVSALVALSFYEPLVRILMGGKFANYAHGLMLLCLFALCYTLLRTVFDKAIPGNVRVPNLIDRIGGAAMGVVAGIFAVGVFAIAAQSFPFMPDVAGYTKYAVGAENREVTVPAVQGGRNSYALNRPLVDEVDSDTPGRFDDTKRTPISLLPADDIVVGLLKQHSTVGALSANNPLTAFHPDLLQEYFGQRLGIETGATRVVVNNPGKGLESIRGVELYRIDAPAQLQYADYGFSAFRSNDWKKVPPDRKIQDELKKNPKLMLLVARVRFGKAINTDKKAVLRLSPGSVRLVAGRFNPATNETEQTNYFPVGTVDGANKLVVNRIDDFLFVNTGDERAIDFAFIVDREGLVGKGGAATPAQPAAAAAAGAAKPAPAAQMKVQPTVFFEMNRMGIVQLEDKDVLPQSQYKEDPTVKMMRPIPEKPPEQPQPEQTPTPAPQPAPQPAPATTPLSNKLIGTWVGKATNGAELSLTFNADNTVAYTVGGNPGTGKWSPQGEVNPTTLNITRQLGDNPEETTAIVFNGDDSIALTNAAGVTTNLTRKK